MSLSRLVGLALVAACSGAPEQRQTAPPPEQRQTAVAPGQPASATEASSPVPTAPPAATPDASGSPGSPGDEGDKNVETIQVLTFAPAKPGDFDPNSPCAKLAEHVGVLMAKSSPALADQLPTLKAQWRTGCEHANFSAEEHACMLRAANTDDFVACTREEAPQSKSP